MALTQEELTKSYQKAKDRYQTAGNLTDLSLEDLQTLVAYECWKDGAEFEVALETSYMTKTSAQHYLKQAFGY